MKNKNSKWLSKFNQPIILVSSEDDRAQATLVALGNNQENGGWEPHLHFQLSLIEPLTHDLPGVVSSEDRKQALLDYPDPLDYSEEPNCTQKGTGWVTFNTDPVPKRKRIVKKRLKRL